MDFKSPMSSASMSSCSRRPFTGTRARWRTNSARSRTFTGNLSPPLYLPLYRKNCAIKWGDKVEHKVTVHQGLANAPVLPVLSVQRGQGGRPVDKQCLREVVEVDACAGAGVGME